MKCVRLKVNGTIHRVKDSVAHKLVSDGEASYIPKKEWKELRNNVQLLGA
jgi:hypothetical protein